MALPGLMSQKYAICMAWKAPDNNHFSHGQSCIICTYCAHSCKFEHPACHRVRVTSVVLHNPSLLHTSVQA